MQATASERDAIAWPFTPAAGTTLRLVVRNHPGVMSHICGLFARRCFNLEGIFCLPLGDGSRSAMLLLVKEDERLEQVVRQLRKLEDVLDVGADPQLPQRTRLGPDAAPTQ